MGIEETAEIIYYQGQLVLYLEDNSTQIIYKLPESNPVIKKWGRGVILLSEVSYRKIEDSWKPIESWYSEGEKPKDNGLEKEEIEGLEYITSAAEKLLKKYEKHFDKGE
jgi:hypothetical protein